MGLNPENVRGIICEIPGSLGWNFAVRFDPALPGLAPSLLYFEELLNTYRGAWPNARFALLLADSELMPDMMPMFQLPICKCKAPSTFEYGNQQLQLHEAACPLFGANT